MFKLLIVDDDYITREGIIKHIDFNALGVGEIEEADDGINALEICKNYQPHIILSDIRMPRMNGIDFVLEVRKVLPKVSILFMSAYTEKDYYKSAIHLKAVSFVEKPIDLEELTEAFQSAVKELRAYIAYDQALSKMDKVLEESISFMNNHFVLMLTEENHQRSEIEEKKRALSLDMPSEGLFYTVIIKLAALKNASGSNRQQYEEEVNSCISAAAARFNLKTIFAFKSHDEIVMHVFAAKDEVSTLNADLLSRLCEVCCMQLFSKYKFAASIGKGVRRVEQVWESYRSANAYLERAFFEIEQPIIVYEKEEPSSVYCVNKGLFEAFSALIEQGNEERVIHYIQKTTDEVKKHKDTKINVIKDIYYRFLFVLGQFAGNLQPLGEHSDKEDTLWEHISKIEFLGELEGYVISKIRGYFKVIQDQQDNKFFAGIIMQYIHANYSNPFLSINDISENTSRSQAYICAVFKEETGKTINQYITEYRITKAKVLFKNREMKVLDIAKQVGYNEADYFAKVFKKHTGISPSKFREKCMTS